MIEFFEGLWAAITSGDFQAVLSLIGGTGIIASVIAQFPIRAWLAKIKAKSSTANAYIDSLIHTAETLQADLRAEREQNKAILKALYSMNDANAKVLQIITDRSNLNEETKQAISNVLAPVKSLADTVAKSYLAPDAETPAIPAPTPTEETPAPAPAPTEEETPATTPVGL